jgi:hypothetical protein
MRRNRKQMAIIGPDFPFAHINCGRQMNCITGTQWDTWRKAADQRKGLLQQGIGDFHEIPEIVFDMFSKNVDQLSALRSGQSSLTHMTVEDAGHFK